MTFLHHQTEVELVVIGVDVLVVVEEVMNWVVLAVVDVVVVVDEAVDVYVLVEVGIVELVLAELVVVDEVAEVVVDDVAIVVG